MQMTPEELANIELEKLKQTGYELSFPIDPIKILKDGYLSNTDFVIDADNRRIAQAVIKFVPPVDVNEISLEEMEKRVTERGDGGFGHTGRN